MLLCLTANSAVYAQPNDTDPALWSRSEYRTIVWNTALRICPEQASLYEQEFPETLQRTLDHMVNPENFSHVTEQETETGIGQGPDVDSTAGIRPRSPELIQYVLFITFANFQVGASLALQQEYMDHVVDPENSPVTLRPQTRILTDFTKCLVPTGPRFVASEETGIYQKLADFLEVYTCSNFLEATEQFPEMDLSELTEETFLQERSRALQVFDESCDDNYP